MATRILGPDRSRRRRRSLLVPALLALIVGLVIGVPAANRLQMRSSGALGE